MIAAWRGVLGDAAWVVPREQAVAEGWFGPVRRAAPAAHRRCRRGLPRRPRGAGHPARPAARWPPWSPSTARPRRSRCGSRCSSRGSTARLSDRRPSLRACRRPPAPSASDDAAAASCTSTWTRSSRRSRCAAGPSCAAGRSWSAGPVRAGWSARPATRPGRTACAAPCRAGRPSALCPRRGLPAARLGRLPRGVAGGHGDLPRRHPAGRAALAWTRRSSTWPGRVRLLGRPRRDRRSTIRARVADGAAADLLGRGRVDQVHGQARLDPGQAGRAARRAGRPRRWSSCTRCRSTRCGASGSGRPRRCAGSGLRTVGDVAAGAARDAAPARWARRPPPTCTSWPGAAIRGRSAPSGSRSRSAPRRPSTSTWPTRRSSAGRCWRWPSRVGVRLRAAGLAGRTVSVKVRLADFRTRQPVAHAGRADRRGPGDLRRRPGQLCRRRPGPATGSAWSGSGSRVWSRPRRRPASRPSGEREHGWREAERAATRRRPGSGLGRSVRPACSASPAERPRAAERKCSSAGQLAAETPAPNGARRPDDRSAGEVSFRCS